MECVADRRRAPPIPRDPPRGVSAKDSMRVSPLQALRRRAIVRRTDPLFVEAAVDHLVNLPHQEMDRHLVFGTTELPERCQERKVVECFGRERQAKRPRVRPIFGSRHREVSAGTFSRGLKLGYYTFKILGKRIDSWHLG